MVAFLLSRLWKALGSNSAHSRALVFLAAGVFGLNFGFAAYQSTYTNFFVGNLGIDAFQMGALESLRELPGFLTAFILGSTLSFSPPLLAGFFALLFGFSIAGIATVTSWIQVALWLIMGSIGFHMWQPLQNSMAMDLAEPQKTGKRLGQINSVAAVASIAAMASVAILASFVDFQYRIFFIASGAIAFLFGLLVFKIPPTSRTIKKTRLVFKKRYRTYYLISFFEGARRQIFFTFSPFVLVKIFSLPVTTVSFTMFVSQALTLILAPYIGKTLDRIGPRTVLSISYILMIGDFLGYAYFRNIYVLLGLYALSSILMVVSVISLATYVNQLTDPMDLTPTLAMGQTIEHVAAVAMPLAGGILWDFFGYQTTFLIGTATAGCLLLAAQKIRTARKPTTSQTFM